MSYSKTLHSRLLCSVIAVLLFAALGVSVELPEAQADRRGRLSEKEAKKLRRRMEREYLSKCPDGTQPTGQLPPDGNKFYCQVPTRKRGLVRHGEYNHWYSNGEKRLQGEYYMGKKHGVWKMYRRDGSLKSQETYYNGQRQEQLIYDRDGKPSEQGDRKSRLKNRRKKNLWRHGGSR